MTSLFFQPRGAPESYQPASTRCQSAQLCFQALLTSVHGIQIWFECCRVGTLNFLEYTDRTQLPNRAGSDLSGAGRWQSCCMLSLLNSRSIIKDRVALDKASDLPSICTVAKTKPVFLIDLLGILIGHWKTGEIWITGIWTSLWLHFFILYRKLSLFRLSSVTSGTVRSLIIQNPPIQRHFYLCIFLHSFFDPM